MNITLYRTNSDHRKLNKTLTSIASGVAICKDDNSLTDPHLTIKTFGGWQNVNYVYIEDFRRYYWVTDIQELTGGQLSLVLHVDVLMSFKNELNDLRVLVNRSSSGGGDYISDDQRRLIAYPQLTTHTFSSQPFTNSLEYVMTLLGAPAS